MSKIWKAFSGEYFFDLNGAPLGSCEEASALISCSASILRCSARRKERHDPITGPRRSHRRLVSARDMGSNVSRRSGKGLSGRRAQSSGSLCKILVPRVSRVLHPCGDEGVRRRDRNKFSGSLPNRLDEKESISRGSTPETLYNGDYEHFFDGPKDVELLLCKLLPPQDPGAGDLGYDSERSPDDVDSPPKCSAKDNRRQRSVVYSTCELPFITKENTFEARLEKGSRGLGLSVTGGIDTDGTFPGLIRIKRIFPHQPASECGALAPGDIILEANGSSLTGLSNYEALEVLRATPGKVVLKVCRPPAEIFPVAFEGADIPPPPPKREPAQHIPLSSQSSNSSNALPQSSLPIESCGEFEVILTKVNGSLGFTLRKEDESVLGHYIRALVREPAISDERIRPGDKIVSVNGADISSLSHEEAVAFLRQSGEKVRLRLYRDPVQTPISALSPAESHKIFRPKPALRKEAVDMLCDLAFKKFAPGDSAGKSRPRSISPGSSPRRRRLTKGPARRDDPDASESRLDFPDPRPEAPALPSQPPAEPVSMPPLTACPPEFDHGNPVYRSARPANYFDGKPDQERVFTENVPDAAVGEGGGTQGLLKWKGIVFSSGNGSAEETEEDQLITVELSRGWNSRLGFGLRGEQSATLISAIYPDSVAAKDGRLRAGDKIITINGESTKEMATSEMIDLLRRIRGTVVLTVVRKRFSPEDNFSIGDKKPPPGILTSNI